MTQVLYKCSRGVYSFVLHVNQTTNSVFNTSAKNVDIKMLLISMQFNSTRFACLIY